MKIRLADNSSRTIARVHQRLADNSSRLWNTARIRLGDNLSRIGFSSSGPLSVTASPTDVYGAGGGVHTGIVSTNSTTLSIEGGAAPYVISWSSDPDWNVSNPTGLTTSFSSSIAPGDLASHTFTATVTDAHGDTANCDVNATVERFGGEL